ncbi:ATP synthase subunit I [Uliginosibacterium sp. H1]|uniref:ATP synthase subunit I n=1 Tax=Uliginosibacterium sp. H1 TaxID=3114757 RepID=UPI002E17D4F4|nr:ATP synthase subunit I [Uliginosibacterium sp. H1]
MYKVVRLQSALALLGVLLGAAFFGLRGALSAAIGGAACVIPSLLFAWRLSRAAGQPGASRVGTFVAGELLKLVLVVGILIAAGRLYPGTHWGAVVLGLALTLQANFFAFLIRT